MTTNQQDDLPVIQSETRYCQEELCRLTNRLLECRQLSLGTEHRRLTDRLDHALAVLRLANETVANVQTLADFLRLESGME